MRSAIVTGANGFVGSEIVRNLVNHGFNVYALYNRSKNRLETIEKCRTVHCPMDQFSKIPEKIQDSPDFIFHCAWSGSSGEDRTNIQLQLSNVTSTCALI